MSKGLAQGPYVAARVRFEPATLRTQGTELTTEPPCPLSIICFMLLRSQVFSAGTQQTDLCIMWWWVFVGGGGWFNIACFPDHTVDSSAAFNFKQKTSCDILQSWKQKHLTLCHFNILKLTLIVKRRCLKISRWRWATVSEGLAQSPYTVVVSGEAEDWTHTLWVTRQAL